jgi:large conductance mechanosensitive channel
LFVASVRDLAGAVVMGAAFGAVVTALVKDLITPLTAAIIGKPDFSSIEFSIHESKFPVGGSINALVSFTVVREDIDPRDAPPRPLREIR